MEILSKTSMKVTEETYVIQHPIEGILHYKEWLNEKGEVIDSTLRTKQGIEIDYNPALLEEIWGYIEQHQ